MKSGIVILYFHRKETKFFSEYYLSYIYDLKLSYKEFKNFSGSNKKILHNKLVRKVFQNRKENLVYQRDIINVNGDLNSDIFKEIMDTIGLFTEEEYEIGISI